MTKFKTTKKIALALFTLLQLGARTNASDAANIELLPYEFENAVNEIGEVFDVLKIVNEIKEKFNIIYELKFKDVENYPQMSLSDLGDEIIEIIDHATGLPLEIRENLKKLVEVKKMSNSIAEIKAPHALISEILIQLANFKLDRVNKGLEVLLKHFDMIDIVRINQEVTAYRKSVEKLKDRKIYKNIDDIESDLKKILTKIETILKKYPLYSSFKTRNCSTEKTLTALEQASESMKLLKLFNYRIAQNRRK